MIKIQISHNLVYIKYEHLKNKNIFFKCCKGIRASQCSVQY